MKHSCLPDCLPTHVFDFQKSKLFIMGCGTSAPTQTEVPEEGGVGEILAKKKFPDNFVVPHVETVLADVYAVGDKATDGDEVSVEPVEANNNIGVRPKTSNPNLNR